MGIILTLVFIHNWLSLRNLPFIVNMVSEHHLLILQTLVLFGSFEMSRHLYFHCQGKKKIFIAFYHVFLITAFIILYRVLKQEKIMSMHC